MLINEGDHRLNGRSSSAWAKCAVSLSLHVTSTGTPARLPLLTSCYFAHSSSVCPEQPIIAAMEVIGNPAVWIFALLIQHQANCSFKNCRCKLVRRLAQRRHFLTRVRAFGKPGRFNPIASCENEARSPFCRSRRQYAAFLCPYPLDRKICLNA